jgi:hypothetical protein
MEAAVAGQRDCARPPRSRDRIYWRESWFACRTQLASFSLPLCGLPVASGINPALVAFRDWLFEEVTHKERGKRRLWKAAAQDRRLVRLIGKREPGRAWAPLPLPGAWLSIRQISFHVSRQQRPRVDVIIDMAWTTVCTSCSGLRSMPARLKYQDDTAHRRGDRTEAKLPLRSLPARLLHAMPGGGRSENKTSESVRTRL